jgi:hypothetical protein
VGEQSVRVRMPDGISAKKVQMLVGDGSPAVQNQGADLTVGVPSILDHEVVAIDI